MRYSVLLKSNWVLLFGSYLGFGCFFWQTLAVFWMAFDCF